ncbi:TRAP transporter large permease [Ahrensia sp. R2A130]|uniref:TRAP transporter large permease n=1 Tax=Ahrensia sp. R2A130 TaxID=744979 RepID=UPI0001E0C9F7|nr:TRAP transporter large permease [Ahrensia sp. R2A130]EFL88803.1 trap c4-dicarboxylate transport system permease dctm subunit [Ahrensia sp. R2A130]
MENLTIGYLSLPVLLVLIFARMPIGLAMLVVGLGGTMLITGGPTVVLAKLKNETYSTFSSYSLSIIPLFLLMGQFATLGGMSAALFKAAETWLGHRRGGLAMASVGACAGFGAICGSSLATAATMGQVALPQLKKYGYPGGLATATLAAGGTLGILIPPSVVLVIYAILTEQNIAKLFLAAFIPGFLAAAGYMITISIIMRVSPSTAQLRERVPYAERFKAMADVWPVLLVFFLVVGGIYLGWFTPTEAAAVGAAGTGIIAWLAGGLSRSTFSEAVLATASNTGMIFIIVLGAGFFNAFLALTRVPQELSSVILELGLSPWTILIVILFLYLIFGCFMDSLSMILLTIPIFFPIISTLNFGLTPEETAIWFGILVLIVVEVGLITPPVGMNLFVINAIDPRTRILDTYRAVLPFVASDIIRTAILVAFPGITLFLLRWLY